jgi:DNA-binding CsgD family transcriptional regulator
MKTTLAGALMLAESPRTRQFLSGLPDKTRWLDGLRQRLTKEGSPVVLLRADDEERLVAHLASRSGGVGDDRAVLLTDLHDFQVPHENILRAVFDLTPAEVRLAQAITRGDTLDEVATSLGIKMPTARTQLAAIFAKTGTQRQAKLVAILTRLALLVG